MRKLFSTIILTSLFAISFNSVKPFVREKVPMGFAIGVFVGSAALLTTIIYLKNDKKDQSDIKQDFISEKDGIDEIDKQELEKIYGKDKKSGGLVAKILGLGVLPSAAIGGGVYWWLSGYTPSGYKRTINKGLNDILQGLGEGFSDGKTNLFDEKVKSINLEDDRIDECIDGNFDSLPDCRDFLREQKKILQNYIGILDKLKDEEKTFNFTNNEEQIFNDFRKKTSNLSKNIARVIRHIKSKHNYESEKRDYNKLRREEKLQDNIRSERNHEHARDAMWMWTLLNGIGKVTSIFGG